MKKKNEKEITLLEDSTKVIKTEYATINNNFCIDEGRSIVKRLSNLVMRSGNCRLSLQVKTKENTISYNCTTFVCPRLEVRHFENGIRLVITDGNNLHNISPFDNINALRKIYKYAIGD